MPRLWKDGKVKHTHANAIAINSTLDNMAQRATQLHTQYITDGAFPTPNQYIADILGAQQTPVIQNDFFAYYRQYISYLKDRGVTRSFQDKHAIILRQITAFQRATGFQIEFATIGKTFAAKFTAWFTTTQKPTRRRQNLDHTVQRYFKEFLNFMRHAHGEGWTTETAWRKIHPQINTPKFPITITQDEITRLTALTPADLPCDARKAAAALLTRDWFLFGTQTSMRWSDWRAGKYRFINLMPIGYNLQFTAQKTQDNLEIPLTNIAIEILERHAWALPPCYAPSTTIGHLAILAQAAGIRKHLTTHTARRTFCTLQEAAGVPRAFIMRITGHKKERDYLRYTGITFALNADLMRRANPEMFKTAG